MKKRIFKQPKYTKFKTLNKLQEVFNKYPQQVPSGIQAFEHGLVADFIDPITRRILSASEIKCFYNCEVFEVDLLDGNRVLIKENNGKFIIKVDKKQ